MIARLTRPAFALGTPKVPLYLYMYTAYGLNKSKPSRQPLEDGLQLCRHSMKQAHWCPGTGTGSSTTTTTDCTYLAAVSLLSVWSPNPCKLTIPLTHIDDVVIERDENLGYWHTSVAYLAPVNSCHTSLKRLDNAVPFSRLRRRWSTLDLCNNMRATVMTPQQLEAEPSCYPIRSFTSPHRHPQSNCAV